MKPEFVANEHLRAPTAGAIGVAAAVYYRKNEPSLWSFFWQTAFILATIRVGIVGKLDSAILFDPPLPTIIAFGTYLFGLVATIGYYRVFSASHPLHDIPGPFLAKLTKLRFFFLVQSGHSRSTMKEWHAKYGPVLRIAPNEISVADANAVLPVHGAHSWIRGASYSATVHSKTAEANSNASLLNLPDRETLSITFGKIWDRAFSIGSLRDYEPMVLARLHELCQQLDARQKGYVNFNDWASFFVFDVTSDLAYGGGTSFLKSGADQFGVVEGVVASMRLQGKTMALPWLAPLLVYAPSAAKGRQFLAYCHKRTEQRCLNGNPEGNKDFISHLLEQKDDEEPLSKTCLAAETTLIMAAGADTTKIALAILFAYLIKYPHYCSQLQKALDKAIGKNETTRIDKEEFPTHDQIKGIPLVDAYLNETLRLHPPLSLEPLRQAPAGGAVLAGVPIPGGASVRIMNHIIQSDPANFPDPLEFKPERWLKGEENGVFDARYEKGSFFPFLYGPFHCVGKQFAYQEMRLLLVTLVWKYNFHFKPGFNFDAWLTSIDDNGSLLDITKPLMVQVTRRT